MTGMDRNTGRALDANGDAHLVQSHGDILTTPLGSRVGRRDYGSILPELVDQPRNPLNTIRCYAAAAGALLRWEPRSRVERLQLVAGVGGAAALRLSIARNDQPRRGVFDLLIPIRPA